MSQSSVTSPIAAILINILRDGKESPNSYCEIAAWETPKFAAKDDWVIIKDNRIFLILSPMAFLSATSMPQIIRHTFKKLNHFKDYLRF